MTLGTISLRAAYPEYNLGNSAGSLGSEPDPIMPQVCTETHDSLHLQSYDACITLLISTTTYNIHTRRSRKQYLQRCSRVIGYGEAITTFCYFRPRKKSNFFEEGVRHPRTALTAQGSWDAIFWNFWNFFPDDDLVTTNSDTSGVPTAIPAVIVNAVSIRIPVRE